MKRFACLQFAKSVSPGCGRASTATTSTDSGTIQGASGTSERLPPFLLGGPEVQNGHGHAEAPSRTRLTTPGLEPCQAHCQVALRNFDGGEAADDVHQDETSLARADVVLEDSLESRERTIGYLDSVSGVEALGNVLIFVPRLNAPADVVDEIVRYAARASVYPKEVRKALGPAN